jgi:hypothetical protein
MINTANPEPASPPGWGRGEGGYEMEYRVVLSDGRINPETRSAFCWRCFCRFASETNAARFSGTEHQRSARNR